MMIETHDEILNLAGVPETMLWPLYNRAAEARRPDGLLRDPLSVTIADTLDYDYLRSFGRPEIGHVVRSLVIDGLLIDWLRNHPGGQVVALGEGLETQFHRVDNGQVHWLSVDLPESIAIRSRFLPETDRHRNLSCSALDLRWMDEVDANHGIYITAAGLLMYFQPAEVHHLLRAIAMRFPDAEMAFDVIPRWLSRKSLRGWRKTADYTTPPMPWGLDRDEVASLRDWHPNIAEVRTVPFRGGQGLVFRVLLPLLRSSPGVRNWLPAIVRLRCRRGLSSVDDPEAGVGWQGVSFYAP